MIIKNTLPRLLEVLLNGKKYTFAAGASMEVSDEEGKWILRIQPLLTSGETVEIHAEPAVIEKPQPDIVEPKAKKNVGKSKKPRK